MSNTIYRVKDTMGRDWHVIPGDPAHPLLDQLKKVGFESPRLPPMTYLSGVISPDALGMAIHTVDDFVGEADDDLDDALLTAYDSERQIAFLLNSDNPT